MKKKALTGGLLSLLLIKIGILVAILLLASYFSLRLDLSRGRIYSLAEVSKDAVRSLEDRLVVKIYASEDLPPNLVSTDRYLRDILSEYKLNGGRNFQYQYVKTDSPEELARLAAQSNLQRMIFQTFENDQMSQKEVIYGISMEYRGVMDSFTIPPELDSKLEYMITNRIRKISGYELPQLVVFRDSTYLHYLTEIAQDGTMMERGLDENYYLSATTLMQPVRQDYLLFTGAETELTREQLYNLDQFIMRGGKLVMLQDRISTDGYGIYNLENELFTMLASYGIKIGEDMILDLQCDYRRMGASQVPYPFWPVLRGSESHPTTRNIANIWLYFASEVSTTDSLSLQYTPILRTSPNSAKEPGPQFDVQRILSKAPTAEFFSHPPIGVGALFTGSMQSYFAGEEEYASREGFIRETNNAELIVYGDKELTWDPDKQEYADRNFIVLNAIDYLRGDISMINIRSRSIQESFLDVREYMERKNLLWGDQAKTERNIKNTVRVISIVVPPLLMLAVLLVILAIQKKRSYRSM